MDMRKLLTVVLILVGVGFALVLGLLVLLILGSRQQMAPETYWDSVQTGGDLEKTYTTLGSFDVAYLEQAHEDPMAVKYEIWYPAELAHSEARYPLVIMANGTGVTASKYKAVFHHLASWGFIVVGDEVQASALGSSTARNLDHMLALNEDPDSLFYQKIDTAHIGLAGHSQGGFGVLRAALDYENSSRYTCIFTASATTQTMLDLFIWKRIGEITTRPGCKPRFSWWLAPTTAMPTAFLPWRIWCRILKSAPSPL